MSADSERGEQDCAIGAVLALRRARSDGSRIHGDDEIHIERRERIVAVGQDGETTARRDAQEFIVSNLQLPPVGKTDDERRKWTSLMQCSECGDVHGQEGNSPG